VKTASPDTICFTLQPSAAPSQERQTAAVDSLIARPVTPGNLSAGDVNLDPGSLVPGDPTAIDPDGTLAKGRGKKMPFFKCDSEAAGGPTCTCKGSEDCLRLGVADACVKGTTMCDNTSPQMCSCQWNV
jgi:hypothetical protein